jgi:hypothetical protein
MHSDFHEITLREHGRDLDRSARNAFQRRVTPATPPVPLEAVVLRLCRVHDDATLDRLAELEGRPAPKGRHIVAEVGGTVVAALPLQGGVALADPFRATAHLMPLLELRAKQLGGEWDRPRRVALWGAVRSWSRA